MSDVVVDSSVAVKWFLTEPDTPAALRVYDQTTLAGGRLFVLDLALVEIANALWKRYHRGLMSRPQVDERLETLLRSPVEVRPAAPLLLQGFAIAADYDRSVYDALFVALAADLGLPGVTADEPLHGAVRAKFPGITLLRDWP